MLVTIGDCTFNLDDVVIKWERDVLTNGPKPITGARIYTRIMKGDTVEVFSAGEPIVRYVASAMIINLDRSDAGYLYELIHSDPGIVKIARLL